MGDDARVECSTDGCSRVVKATGLCHRHYDEKRANGRQCSVEGCAGTPRGRGMCSMHYYRWQKYGDPGEAALRRKPTRPCKVEGCSNTATTSADLCPTHARRKKLYGTEDGLFRTHRQCVTCGDPAVSSPRSDEYCREHYIAYIKRLCVEGRASTTGDGRGYRYISVFKKTYAVHAVVMEHILNRPLKSGESVHHKNGRRDDNRPENLELWVKPQLAGQRVEDLVSWVVETYPEFVRAAVEGHPHLFVS